MESDFRAAPISVMQAWLLPMIFRPDLRPLFSLYALLYAAPLLKDGFGVTDFAFVMGVLGALHITVSTGLPL
jgi:hypothetical protein